MLRQAHEENGVAFQLGTAVEKFEGEDAVKTVVLKNGIRIDADLVLIGIGVTPNTGYLQGCAQGNGRQHQDRCLFPRGRRCLCGGRHCALSRLALWRICPD